MADQWIKMRTDLSTDPAVIAIAGATGLDEDHVVGKLHRLWSWADGQLRDGNAPSVTGSWVDRYLGAPGFAEAMQTAGWLTIADTGISFPNFDRHMSTTAKKRALTARRVARHKRDGNAPSVTKALPREEKRREEKEKQTPLSPPRGKRSAKPADVEIPETLDTPDFRAAWGEWLAYRRERKATCSARTLSKQLAMLAELGPAVAIESIENSIRGGWQGLFQPKAEGNHNGKPRYADGPGQVHPDTPRRF